MSEHDKAPEQTSLAKRANEIPEVHVEKPELERLVRQSVMVALKAESFRGPMPKPEHMAHYDKIVPGAARIIVEEFQANSKHSREMEKLGLQGMIGKDRRAQYIAGGLVLVGVGVTWILAEHGHDKVAIAIAGLLLVSVLSAFLTGSIKSKKTEPDTEDDS